MTTTFWLCRMWPTRELRELLKKGDAFVFLHFVNGSCGNAAFIKRSGTVVCESADEHAPIIESDGARSALPGDGIVYLAISRRGVDVPLPDGARVETIVSTSGDFNASAAASGCELSCPCAVVPPSKHTTCSNAVMLFDGVEIAARALGKRKLALGVTIVDGPSWKVCLIGFVKHCPPACNSHAVLLRNLARLKWRVPLNTVTVDDDVTEDSCRFLRSITTAPVDISTVPGPRLVLLDPRREHHHVVASVTLPRAPETSSPPPWAARVETVMPTGELLLRTQIDEEQQYLLAPRTAGRFEVPPGTHVKVIRVAGADEMNDTITIPTAHIVPTPSFISVLQVDELVGDGPSLCVALSGTGLPVLEKNSVSLEIAVLNEFNEKEVADPPSITLLSRREASWIPEEQRGWNPNDQFGWNPLRAPVSIRIGAIDTSCASRAIAFKAQFRGLTNIFGSRIRLKLQVFENTEAIFTTVLPAIRVRNDD